MAFYVNMVLLKFDAHLAYLGGSFGTINIIGHFTGQKLIFETFSSKFIVQCRS